MTTKKRGQQLSIVKYVSQDQKYLQILRLNTLIQNVLALDRLRER